MRRRRQFTFLPIDGMGQLIVFRGLQGIGAGMIIGVLFTIVGDIFSPHERGKYQGLFAASSGVASIFGPTLGGWLTDSLVVARLLLRESAGRHHRGGGDPLRVSEHEAAAVSNSPRLGRLRHADRQRSCRCCWR